MADFVLPGSQTMSTQTVATLNTKVRALLNEKAEAFWVDTDILDWINQGVGVISAQALCLGTTLDITIAADTLEYDLATLAPDLRYADAIAAIYEPEAADAMKGLEKSGPHKIGSSPVAEEQPSYYWLVDGRIGLFPAQSTGDEAVGKKVRIYFAELAQKVSATTDLIPLPEIYETPLIHFVIGMAKYKDDRPGEAREFMALFDSVIQRYRLDFLETDEDE